MRNKRTFQVASALKFFFQIRKIEKREGEKEQTLLATIKRANHVTTLQSICTPSHIFASK